MIKCRKPFSSLGMILLACLSWNLASANDVITLTQYRDKMQGSWIAQMGGAQWGQPFEFKYPRGMISDPLAPLNNYNHLHLHPTSVGLNGAYGQDQLYIQIPFLQAMTALGPQATWSEFGSYFRDTTFPLWSANANARSNLLNGIQAPMSGHYFYNSYSYALSTMIGSSFAGDINPGNVNGAAELSWRAAHVGLYGNGVYGFAHMAAMHAAAYFASSIPEIINAGSAVIPPESQYGQMIRDVLTWSQRQTNHAEDPVPDASANPTGWMAVWSLLEKKYDFQSSASPNIHKALSNDAILHGGYVLIGLIYGDGDFAKSVRITIRAGSDTDCSGSMMAGILGAYLGLSKLPTITTQGINLALSYEGYGSASHPTVTTRDIFTMTEDLTRKTLLMHGGTVSRNAAGDETWTIANSGPAVSLILEQYPYPAPAARDPNALPLVTAAEVSRSGTTVHFSAAATDTHSTIRDYQWFFGDLTYGSGNDVFHTFPAAGTYQVLAYATNQIGNTGFRILNVTVGPLTNPIRVNAGGIATGNFASDRDFVGGNATVSTVRVDTSRVVNPAPQGVYASRRTGQQGQGFHYLFSNLSSHPTYLVRLHFAELLATGIGQRRFNVVINGVPVLQSFDILSEAGGPYIAVIKEFTVRPDGNGQIKIEYTYGDKGNPDANGIEVLPQ